MIGLKQEVYIYFLRLEGELPWYFFKMANYLGDYSVTLVPVTVNELADLAQGNKQYVFTACVNLTQHQILKRIRQKYLDFTLLNKTFCLYHLSSFQEFDIAAKARYNKCYEFYPLPSDMKDIAYDIALRMYEENNESTSWPGGRRAKLPPMNN